MTPSLLLVLSALAHAEEPAPVAAPVAASATPVAGVAPASAPQEVRETYDAAGNLVRRLTLTNGALTEEVSATYDAAGHRTEQRTVIGPTTTVETSTYTADGLVAGTTRSVNGAVVSQEAFTYADGRVATHTVTDASGARTTTYTYDAAGHAVAAETRTAEGRLLERSVADRAAPPPAPAAKVPFNIGVNAGVATNSDVRSNSVTAGFTFGRKPPAELYKTDHLEVGAFGNYTHTTSAGTPTNDDLKAGFGLDYNDLVGRMTAFLFTTVERNPVANLDVDLLVAPIGVKYDFVPSGVFTFDASFAPVWNFRSIAVPAGGTCDDLTLDQDGHCAFSKIRGSFRMRASVGNANVKLKDVVEFLPTLNPTDGDIIGAIDTESIFRNTASLDVKLTGHLGISESVLFVRDPLLAAQADCTADPDNLLCSGMSLQTGTMLTLTYSL